MMRNTYSCAIHGMPRSLPTRISASARSVEEDVTVLEDEAPSLVRVRQVHVLREFCELKHAVYDVVHADTGATVTVLFAFSLVPYCIISKI